MQAAVFAVLAVYHVKGHVHAAKGGFGHNRCAMEVPLAAAVYEEIARLVLVAVERPEHGRAALKRDVIFARRPAAKNPDNRVHICKYTNKKNALRVS
jgi:hypothetical protein